MRYPGLEQKVFALEGGNAKKSLAYSRLCPGRGLFGYAGGACLGEKGECLVGHYFIRTPNASE